MLSAHGETEKKGRTRRHGQSDREETPHARPRTRTEQGQIDYGAQRLSLYALPERISAIKVFGTYLRHV
jgi:hypothetical protein